MITGFDRLPDVVCSPPGCPGEIADLGKGVLLNALYLSIMDVGTSYLRAKLETVPADDIDLAPLADVMVDLVEALQKGDADAAVDALRRTVPTVILRPGS